MIFIDLYASGIIQLTDSGDKRNPSTRNRWNWPIMESFFYPGADIAVFAANSTKLRNCGINIPLLSSGYQSYLIDVSKVFKCASDNYLFGEKMPENQNINVSGVHWYMETQGTSGKLDMAVQNIQMTF